MTSSLSPGSEAFCLAFAKLPIGARAYAAAVPASLTRSPRYRSERARRLLRKPSIAAHLQALGVELPESSRMALAEHQAKQSARVERHETSRRAGPRQASAAAPIRPTAADPTSQLSVGTTTGTRPVTAAELTRILEAAVGCGGDVTITITIRRGA